MQGLQRRGRGPTLLEDESQQTRLYGEWQTQPWKAPKAKDGVVPKNERGTVHCPPLAAALPQVRQSFLTLHKPWTMGLALA